MTNFLHTCKFQEIEDKHVFKLWHRFLGHLYNRRIRLLYQNLILAGEIPATIETLLYYKNSPIILNVISLEAFTRFIKIINYWKNSPFLSKSLISGRILRFYPNL